ncbi:MAG: bifunctional 5,6,7,8-tetrahydromethanopterin hydro-lyase/3-hexulose-6-phosphate synthase, partial [Candidatus Methanofastidiosia archaeon]
MYEIGEALIGSGNEVAHVDLLIGTKDSPVGIAFATGLSQLSFGHTPLLGVIRPNLLAKPAVLIVPKVTVKGLKDASKIFGPAQTAVARAVVDSVEEGLFEEDELDEIVIIASVFVHPKAKDFRKIYQYNYGATRLAIRRALKGYPPIKKILKEKDRGKHPIMGFRVQRLWNPPYLQVALDMDSLERVEKV